MKTHLGIKIPEDLKRVYEERAKEMSTPYRQVTLTDVITDALLAYKNKKPEVYNPVTETKKKKHKEGQA